jgi:hypothetical protein
LNTLPHDMRAVHSSRIRFYDHQFDKRNPGRLRCVSWAACIDYEGGGFREVEGGSVLFGADGGWRLQLPTRTFEVDGELLSAYVHLSRAEYRSVRNAISDRLTGRAS